MTTLTTVTCPNCGKAFRDVAKDTLSLCNPCFVHSVTSKVLADFGWKK